MTSPTVDYTSRDYLAIRQDLLDPVNGLAAQLIPEWTSRSSNDFGVIFAELFAYVGDQLHYYADRVASEAYLDTATQRSSVMRIARLLGYTPTGYTAASTALTFYNNSASPISVPALAQVGNTIVNPTDPTVIFETDSAVTVPANGSVNVTAHHGSTTTSEVLASQSDGTVDQTYALFHTPVVDPATPGAGFHVYVDSGSGPVEWTFMPSLLNSAASDQVYTTTLDENDVVSVRFGDGANGAIPPYRSAITATYRVGGGVIGNIAAGALTRIISNLSGNLTVTNAAAATGGADRESTESIRNNAGNSIQTLQRAVSLSDYANLAVTYPNVGKANGVGTSNTSATVYIAKNGGGAADATLIANAQTFLQGCAPANTTVTVLDATYITINVTVTVTLAPQYVQSRVQQQCISALDTLLSFDSVVFADTLSLTDLHLALASVPGVAWANVTVFDRDSGSGNNSSITLAANEVPVAGSITVNTTGGISG